MKKERPLPVTDCGRPKKAWKKPAIYLPVVKTLCLLYSPFPRLPKELFFGLTDQWVAKQEQVRVSDPEQTIVDGRRMD